jgi:hypothetical protein
MSVRLDIDPCLVAGTLVAGRFEDYGVVIREGFENHDRVRRWLRKWGNPPYRVEPQSVFEQLIHDGIEW